MFYRAVVSVRGQSVLFVRFNRSDKLFSACRTSPGASGHLGPSGPAALSKYITVQIITPFPNLNLQIREESRRDNFRRVLCTFESQILPAISH